MLKLWLMDALFSGAPDGGLAPPDRAHRGLWAAERQDPSPPSLYLRYPKGQGAPVRRAGRQVWWRRHPQKANGEGQISRKAILLFDSRWF